MGQLKAGNLKTIFLLLLVMAGAFFAQPYLVAAQGETPCITWDGTGTIPSACDDVAQVLEFTARSERGFIELRWRTDNESETVGYNLYRGTDTTGPGAPLNGQLIAAQHNASNVYLWRDTNVVPGRTYLYWLEDIDDEGNRHLHGPVVILHQNPSTVVLDDLAVTSAPLPAYMFLLLAVAAFLVVLRLVLRR